MMAFAIEPKGDIVQQHTEDREYAPSPPSIFRRRALHGAWSSTTRTPGSHCASERHPLSRGTSEAAHPLSRSTSHTSQNLPLGGPRASPSLSTCAPNLRRPSGQHRPHPLTT